MGWDQREIKGYIVDIDTNERLEFQYNPDDIADDKSTDYACRLRISDLRLTIDDWNATGRGRLECGN